MKLSVVAQSNTSISLKGERVVVAGGTQGIGEGVAQRFAKAGAEVCIVGRSEARATAVLAKLKEISEAQKIEPIPEHYFFKADLSLVSEAKRVAGAIRTRAGSQGVDYLVMCQGGPPNGTFVLTPEKFDQHYGVQILSRFVLAHELAADPASSTIKKGVMSIMAPGKNYATVDPNDLDMSKANERGTYGIWTALSRDSAVVDAFTEDLAARNANVNFTHVYPGFVKTDFARNSAVPWYMHVMSSVASIFMGRTAEEYADVPFYLLANPEGRTLAAKEKFFDENVVKVEAHPSAKDNNHRAKIWEHLMEIMKTKN